MTEPENKPPPALQLSLVRSVLPRTFALVFEAAPRLAIRLGLATIVGGLLPLAQAWVGKEIIDGVVAAAASHALADRDRALFWVLTELLLMGLTAFNSRSNDVLRAAIGAEIGYLTNVRILEKAIGLDLRRFEDPSVYDRLQNARRDASTRPLGLFMRAVGLGRDLVSLLSYGAVLISFSPLALLCLGAAALPSLVSEAKFAKTAYSLLSWRAPKGRLLLYYEVVLTRDSYAKEVKIYGLGRWFLDRYKDLYRLLDKEDRKLKEKHATASFLLGLLSSAAFYGVYAWIVLRTVEGELSLGRMTMLLLVFRQAQASLHGILRAVSGAYEDGLFMSHLFEFLGLDGPLRALPAPPAPPPVITPLRTGFVLTDVGFRYPGRKEWALEGISLSIGAAEKLAIVGQNGAGKSTLVKLLTGLYRADHGRIALDGVPIDDLPREVLFSRFGIVLQDFVHYQLALRENVGFGAIDAVVDDPRLLSTLERAGAKELTARLPAGLDTQLGKWFDGGHELSGGEWQKIALARAFLRGAPIWILDEPSSSLDAEAEHELFAHLRALSEGKMAILISHRFSTVRIADRILVLEKGRLAELGSHAELMERDGLYAHLFRLQAEGYLV
ncbi:MAG: ABC transporter ATP-binding protein [Myxococcota bacterium]